RASRIRTNTVNGLRDDMGSFPSLLVDRKPFSSAALWGGHATDVLGGHSADILGALNDGSRTDRSGSVDGTTEVVGIVQKLYRVPGGRQRVRGLSFQGGGRGQLLESLDLLAEIKLWPDKAVVVNGGVPGAQQI